MLVELAHSASALIVGEGEHDEGLADRIRVLADCPVVTVPPLVA